LKKVIHPTQKFQPLPELLTEGHELNLIPKVVLDCRINDVGQQEILVIWKQLLIGQPLIAKVYGKRNKGNGNKAI